MHLLYAGAVSAAFELDNHKPYYAPAPYTVFLNGEEVLRDERNVFSLYDLTPGTAYEVTLAMGEERETLSFTTAQETCAVSVRAFGAVGDGAADDTRAITAAIQCLPKGGRLVFPAGTYRTGPLFLKSHMTLELKKGAVLLGSADKADYPVIPGTAPDEDGGDEVHFGSFEGIARPMYQALITAEYAEDITIVGPGSVDGNAPNGTWWQTYREDPVARPRLFFLNRCRDVTVHGVDAKNSASWQFHPYFSDRLRFLDVAVSAPKDSPNTDALDPEACDDVQIIGCRFSVGDDCIAIKSGKIELGRKFKRPASRHTIRNCLMAFGHGAITLGSEIGGGVRELEVNRCLFKKTDRGLRIKSRRGRGEDCVIDYVAFSNIEMEDVLTPIVINMWYNCVDPDGETEYVWSREKLPIDERTPRLRRFSFRDMTCTGAQVAAAYIDGLTEMPIEEVELRNVSVAFREDARPGIPAMENFAEERCRLGFWFENVKKVRLENVTLTGEEGDKLITRFVDSVEGEVR